MKHSYSEKEIDDAFDREFGMIELLDNAPFVAAWSDRNGHFVKLNRTWERVTGYSEKEMLNRPWVDFVHPDDVESSLDQFRNGELFNKESRVFNHFLNRYKVKTGGWVLLSWQSSGVNNEIGNFAIADVLKFEK